MSQEGKPKVARIFALEVAKEICALLKPVTERLCVCGSLRRGAMVVGDVEILFIPKFEERPLDMFLIQDFDLAADKINRLVPQVIAKRLNALGNICAWGPENKLAIHCASGIAVDLYSTTAEKWFMALVIHTGSKETNLRLTTGAQKLGRKLHAYGSGVSENGHLILAHSEREVFDLCNVGYLEPKDR